MAAVNRPIGDAATPVTAHLTGRRPLAGHTLEIHFSRPEGFDYRPGQRVRFFDHDLERDYTLISTPADQDMAICVRLVAGGRFSALLADAPIGHPFALSGPIGYFTLRPSDRQAVWLATGTGIAPFVAFARAGAEGFFLLHGVRTADQLYYRQLLSPASSSYVPCLTEDTGGPDVFAGRVTDYLRHHLPPGSYDFYLCGRSEMVRDATHIIDERFTDALVYSEIFF